MVTRVSTYYVGQKIRNVLLISAALTGMGVFVSGCGSGSYNSGNASGNAPLAVVSTDPSNGASNVPLSQCPTVTGFCGGVFTVTFNKEVDMTTVNFQVSPNITGFLRCPAAGPGISGCPGGPPGSGIPPNQSAVVMFLAFSSSFMADTTYHVTLVGAKDTNGVPLAESYQWSFSTAAQ
jgi:hypothetical protein